MQYSVLGYAGKIQTSFGDTVTSPQVHSPIIGWAYDGNPIYGPYGYSSKTGGSIVQLKSGYVDETIKKIRKSIVERYIYDCVKNSKS